MMQVPLYRHNLISEDTDALGKQFGKMLSNMMISTGPVNKEVSEQFANYLERKHCLLTSSWSSGMMAILIALNIEPGDEIIIPAMTFAATANIIEVLGAKPIFVDIDEGTKLIDFNKVVAAITNKTKAVIPVHLYGQMVDMQQLKSLIPTHIRIIEDSAHAIESKYNGYRPGTFSDAAVFSFYQSKNMTTGEGGAIVTDDEELYNKVKLAYRHGVDLCGYQRHIREEFVAPDVITAGIKANMPDILAIMLPPQAEENISRRYKIASKYMQELNGLVEMPTINLEVRHAWHMFPIGVNPNSRESILINFFNNGLNTTIHFKSLPQTHYYKTKYGYKPENHPIAYRWGESVFSLPIFPGLTDDEQDYVIATLKNAIKNQ